MSLEAAACCNRRTCRLLCNPGQRTSLANGYATAGTRNTLKQRSRYLLITQRTLCRPAVRENTRCKVRFSGSLVVGSTLLSFRHGQHKCLSTRPKTMRLCSARAVPQRVFPPKSVHPRLTICTGVRMPWSNSGTLCARDLTRDPNLHPPLGQARAPPSQHVSAFLSSRGQDMGRGGIC